MGFKISPGVSVTEKDLSLIVPNIATTPGGFAGQFHWGPCEEVVTLTSERELVTVFGKPKTNNYIDFFTAANFLGYGSRLSLVRVVESGAYNSIVDVTGATGAVMTQQILNKTHFDTATNTITTLPAAGVLFASRYPGVLGNSIKVVVTNGSGTVSGLTTSAAALLGASGISLSVVAATEVNSFTIGDTITFSDGTTTRISGVKPAVAGVFTGLTAVNADFFGVTSSVGGVVLDISPSLSVAQASGNTFSIKSAYAGLVSTAATTTASASDALGSNDIVNILVLDKDGSLTGTVNGVLEKYEALSRASNALAPSGESNYYKTVINNKSNYIWALRADIGSNTAPLASATIAGITVGTTKSNSQLWGGVISLGLTGAADGTEPTDATAWTKGWSKFVDDTTIDVALLPIGDADATLSALIIQNIADVRKDCMVFASPPSSSVVNQLPYAALSAIKTYRDSSLSISSSYAVMDSGWKLQLDTYNNVIRTMPLNADIAGLVGRTEVTNEAWFSPAGYNRGQIKNVVKLAYNPASEGHRDELYIRQVNPVVSFPGNGTILFGDKTMQSKPSAFDRINVRRLFIILEKAIATASKFFLFEQNDAFTRAQFKNMVVPFLKTVMSRRGITDFLVVCDDTNNTGDTIDRGEFIADIFIKPTRSVNFIQLNFIATSTGVSFSEVAGA